MTRLPPHKNYRSGRRRSGNFYSVHSARDETLSDRQHRTISKSGNALLASLRVGYSDSGFLLFPKNGVSMRRSL